MPKRFTPTEKTEILTYLSKHTYVETTSKYPVSEDTLARWTREKKKVIPIQAPKTIPYTPRKQYCKIPVEYKAFLRKAIRTFKKAYKKYSKTDQTQDDFKQADAVMEVIA
jgi:hypothetical protein